MLHELFALDTYRIGHDDAYFITTNRTDQRQTDTLVARSGLHDDGVRAQFPLSFGFQDHIISHAGLDGTTHIEAFKFHQHPGAVLRYHPVQPNHGRTPHGL